MLKLARILKRTKAMSELKTHKRTIMKRDKCGGSFQILL